MLPLEVRMPGLGQGQYNSEKYDDLDHLFAAYVEPLMRRVGEFTHHRKYFEGRASEVQDRVRAERQHSGERASPSTACRHSPYCVLFLNSALDSYLRIKITSQ